ncbi:MAG TPA: aminodeoxychorismate synthase component I [Urbifossiella sp.]|nr:aminodeoxychorismate synthase component I [Urbifossiella sp.]
MDAPLVFDAVPVPTAAGAPLAVELVPAPDPWAVARRLAHLQHLIFFDSAETHPDRGRYSYVAAGPRYGLLARSWHKMPEVLRRLNRRTIPDLPPFQGGFAGLFGYGIGRQFENIPAPRFDEFECPELLVWFYSWVISFDHQTGRAWLVASDFLGPDAVMADGTTRTPPSYAARSIKHVLEELDTPHGEWMWPRPYGTSVTTLGLAPQYPLPGFPGVTSNFSRDGYIEAVARAVEYVHAGDCFQVNLSQRLLAPLREHPLDLYGRLRTLNPAPFAGYFDLGDFQLLSASPERFLRCHPDGSVETRPIKGTRPRGRTPEEDAAQLRDLVANPKDRAENVMIVDLLRNDLGRVCEFGSVTVPRVCEPETFRFVHHLVSEVRGKLRPGTGPFDLLAAAFPGGSVTGAPKVRAMEIIAELEPTARGPYCGALGWVGFDGAMDTNILIRTFTAGRGWVQFPVGGGVVADSDPRREYDETLHKAAGLLKALNPP